MKIICPVCETSIDSDEEFCPVCGFPIRKWFERQSLKKEPATDE